jgi:protein phosphatase
MIENLKNEMAKGPCVVVLIGMSGSGKSTLTAEIISSPDEAVSSDHFRFLLSGSEENQSVSGMAFKMAHQVVNTRSKCGITSVVDATGLMAQHRLAFRDDAHGLPCFAVVLDVPIDVCVARQDMRDRKVPLHVIKRQAQAFEKAKVDVHEEPWDKVFVIQKDSKS